MPPGAAEEIVMKVIPHTSPSLPLLNLRFSLHKLKKIPSYKWLFGSVNAHLWFSLQQKLYLLRGRECPIRQILDLISSRNPKIRISPFVMGEEFLSRLQGNRSKFEKDVLLKLRRPMLLCNFLHSLAKDCSNTGYWTNHSLVFMMTKWLNCEFPGTFLPFLQLWLTILQLLCVVVYPLLLCVPIILFHYNSNICLCLVPVMSAPCFNVPQVK